MLTIIHGSDTAASRKYFLDQKQQHADALLLDADKVNLTDLAQIFEGGGLFGETKHVFIEQLITKKKKNSDYKDIVAYLENQADDHMIILWENKDLEISTTKAFKKAAVKPFKLPQTLFVLMDSLQPGNGKTLVTLFHQTIESAEIEMVLFMLIRQIRILLALSEGNENEIDEIKRMAPWQRQKLEKQARSFTKEELLEIYSKLYAIEYGQKTGNLTGPLLSSIDFLLLEI
jgi:DNA polymerase III delta subunit